MNLRGAFFILLILAKNALAEPTVSQSARDMANLIQSVPCDVIDQVFYAIISVGPGIVAIMFIYGGIKYAYSADDPSGRKQGKTIMIHSLIGAILIMLVDPILNIMGIGGNLCSAMWFLGGGTP